MRKRSIFPSELLNFCSELRPCMASFALGPTCAKMISCAGAGKGGSPLRRSICFTSVGWGVYAGQLLLEES